MGSISFKRLRKEGERRNRNNPIVIASREKLGDKVF